MCHVRCKSRTEPYFTGAALKSHSSCSRRENASHSNLRVNTSHHRQSKARSRHRTDQSLLFCIGLDTVGTKVSKLNKGAMTSGEDLCGAGGPGFKPLWTKGRTSGDRNLRSGCLFLTRLPTCENVDLFPFCPVDATFLKSEIELSR